MAITRLSPMKNLKTTVKGAQNKKPEKEDIGDGGSAYFKWGQNCIDAARQATYAMKNSK
jgi:hypothetical protein